MPLAITVGPFPLCINAEQKEIFLKYFGAIKVIHISKRKYSSTFCKALFNTEIDCENALKKIHQIKLFDKRLSAKYCDALHSEFKIEAHECKIEELQGDDILFNKKYFEHIQKYEALLSSISSKFEVNFPISPKLKYLYPPPTAEVLANIIKALYAVPKFYTQVLHLMNKMNLSCPFEKEEEEEEWPLCEEVKTALKILLDISDDYCAPNEVCADNFLKEDKTKNSEESVCDSESELESDEELHIKMPNSSNPPKRFTRKKIPINKKPKLELLKSAFCDPQVKKRTSDLKTVSISEDVFEKSHIAPNKKMKVHLVNANLPISQKNSASETDEHLQGFGKIHPPQKSTVPEVENQKEKSQFITEQELIDNKIQQKDWPLVPVFKNYNKGSPTCRIYIKNLAKTVTEANLKFIFGRFISWDNQVEVDNFCIRLLKEGRMKGQAFITYSSEKIASQALAEVNGFILKDKPMVIVFGKVKEK